MARDNVARLKQDVYEMAGLDLTEMSSSRLPSKDQPVDFSGESFAQLRPSTNVNLSDLLDSDDDNDESLPGQKREDLLEELD